MEYVPYIVQFIVIIIVCNIIAQAILNHSKSKGKPSSNQSSWEEYKKAQSEIEELEERLKELKGEQK